MVLHGLPHGSEIPFMGIDELFLFAHVISFSFVLLCLCILCCYPREDEPPHHLKLVVVLLPKLDHSLFARSLFIHLLHRTLFGM